MAWLKRLESGGNGSEVPKSISKAVVNDHHGVVVLGVALAASLVDSVEKLDVATSVL